MNFEYGYISMDELIKRGWSLQMAKRLYGEPDMTVSSGYKKKKWRFFNRSKIMWLEKSNEFKKAKYNHLDRSNKRVVKELSSESMFAYEFCKSFVLKIKDFDSDILILRALDAYDEVMSRKFGIITPTKDTCWRHEISRDKLLPIIVEYIKCRESNYCYARNYIEMLRVELTKRGAEFSDYNRCLSVLEVVTDLAVFSKYPEIAMHFDDKAFEERCEKLSGLKFCDVDTGMPQ